MTIEFRIARRDDLPAIVNTYNATIPSRLVTADLEPVSVESREAWFEAHEESRRPLWVVSADGHYAGWMSFNSFYGRPAYNGTAELSIYLNASMRGKGIGKACLSKAIEAAPALGVRNLLGFIFGHNTVSLQLFSSFGFETWANLPGVAELDGVYRDLVIMGLRIAR